MKMTPKKSIRPYKKHLPWKYGHIVFSLELHEIEIACKARSGRGKSTHQHEISYFQITAAGHVDEIIANLKVIK